MPQNPAAPPKPSHYQISELAPGGSDGAQVDDGQDFDPRSDAVNENGANDDDKANNRGPRKTG